LPLLWARNYRPAVGDLPNLGLSVVGFYLEDQAVVVDHGHFKKGDDGLTDASWSWVSYVNLKSHRSPVLFYVDMNRFNLNLVYQGDH